MSSTIRHSHSPDPHGAIRAPPLTAPQRNLASTDHAPLPAFTALSSVSPLQINEMLSSIFSFLDQNTLKTAVHFVCRRWRFIATRYIIHSIRMHHDNKRLLETLQRRLLNINALEVGQKIMRLSWPLSPEDAVRSNEMLDQLILALEQIQSNNESGDRRSSTRDSQHAHNLESDTGRLRIKILTLNLQVPNRLDQLLSLIAPSNLRELTIDLEFSKDPVHLGTVLDLCSNLLHLTLSSHKVDPARGRYFSKSEAWLHSDSDYQGHRPHPLRSLHIINMFVSPRNLRSYFARLGNLTELHCLEIRHPLDYACEDSFWMEDAIRFWEVLARDCPLLESLHFPIDIRTGYSVPVELFPRVHDYCVDYRENSAIGVLEGILENGTEGRLTTLELVPSTVMKFQRYRPYYYADESETCTLLHQLLCSAPLLVHLKTGYHPMQSSVLWGEGDQTGVWACRRLKTLVLALEKDLLEYHGSKVEARHVFAYISRFCPELEELEIEANCPGLSLKSGLCLLTRLRNLQSLTVRGDFLIHDPPDRRELVWIQSPSSPSGIRVSSTSKWLSMFLQGSSVKDAPSVLEEAYLHCIDMAQSLEDNTDTKGRLRMQQQQQDNQFCSEYKDQAFPMVDGLVDMEFSGSYLDIEACLQAQLFRLRRLQHLQALNSSGPQDDVSIKELGEAARAAEVWPQMKKICLVHDRPIPKARNRWKPTAPPKPFHLEERGSHMLHDLRPDITVMLQE